MSQFLKLIDKNLQLLLKTKRLVRPSSAGLQIAPVSNVVENETFVLSVSVHKGTSFSECCPLKDLYSFWRSEGCRGTSLGWWVAFCALKQMVWQKMRLGKWLEISMSHTLCSSFHTMWLLSTPKYL